jgi:hypothetical protein
MQPTLDTPSENIRVRKHAAAIRRASEAPRGVRPIRAAGHRQAASEGRNPRRADMRYIACSDARSHGPVDVFAPVRMTARPPDLVSASANASRATSALRNLSEIAAGQHGAGKADR